MSCQLRPASSKYFSLDRLAIYVVSTCVKVNYTRIFILCQQLYIKFWVILPLLNFVLHLPIFFQISIVLSNPSAAVLPWRTNQLHLLIFGLELL